jgi:hypothetical protein
MPLPHSLFQLGMVLPPYLGDLPALAVYGRLLVVWMLLVLCQVSPLRRHRSQALLHIGL